MDFFHMDFSPDFPGSHIKVLHLNHQYLLARSTRTKSTTVQESLLLWLLVSFTRRNEHLLIPFKARHYFVDPFSSLKMPLSHNKTSNIQLCLLWKSFHLFPHPFLLLSEPSPVQTWFLTSRAEDSQYLMCGWTIDFWACDLLFWLLMSTYLL